MPDTPTTAPRSQRRDSRLRSSATSSSVDSSGAEPIVTTVPTVTPASRIEP